MVAYLRDQLKSDATHTKALSTTAFHNEHQPEPMRSESIQAPTIVYDEHIPNHGRRDDISRLNDRFDRFLSPVRRPGVADDIAIYPRINREEEDMIVARRDHDGSSQRKWRERSRSRPRPSRQDSISTRAGPVISGSRDRSWERPRSQPPRISINPSREIDYYDHYNRRMIGDDHFRTRERARQREEEAWSPERQEIAIRRNERSKSRPRERQILSSSGSEYSYSGSRVRRGQPIVGESGQSQALVLRAGASGLQYDYIRDRVLNGGIRVRGDDDIGSPCPESIISQHVRRPSRPPTSRRNSYRDGSWAPSLRRRLSGTWDQLESSEDDEYDVKRDREKKGSETELSDAEVIAQTLKKYTTIQESDMPATGIAAPPIHKKQASEAEVGPSALKNASHPSPVPERKRSLPVTGRKAHFEQEDGIPQTDQERQTRATNGGSKSVDEGPLLDKISEEPDVMNEDDNILHHQRVVNSPERRVLPSPQQRPSFPFPSDPAHHSREASPRPRSRNSNFESPRARPENGPIILEYGSYTLASQGEATNHAAQEEGYDEVENIRQISRNPTVQEESE